MSQLKSRPSKVQSKVSNEKLGSDHQVSKQKSKNLRRQYANSKPTRKVSPQRNGKQESTTNGVNIVEDLSNKEVAKINLKTLQKIDSGIAKILSTIPHVELYQFKSSENMWVSELKGFDECDFMGCVAVKWVCGVCDKCSTLHH